MYVVFLPTCYVEISFFSDFFAIFFGLMFLLILYQPSSLLFRRLMNEIASFNERKIFVCVSVCWGIWDLFLKKFVLSFSLGSFYFLTAGKVLFRC